MGSQRKECELVASWLVEWLASAAQRGVGRDALSSKLPRSVFNSLFWCVVAVGLCRVGSLCRYKRSL